MDKPQTVNGDCKDIDEQMAQVIEAIATAHKIGETDPDQMMIMLHGIAEKYGPLYQQVMKDHTTRRGS
jgi:hypothetical protein